MIANARDCGDVLRALALPSSYLIERNYAHSTVSLKTPRITAYYYI